MDYNSYYLNILNYIKLFKEEKLSIIDLQSYMKTMAILDDHKNLVVAQEKAIEALEEIIFSYNEKDHLKHGSKIADEFASIITQMLS